MPRGSDKVDHITIYRLSIDGFDDLSFDGYARVKSGTYVHRGVHYPFELYFLRSGLPRSPKWFGVLSQLPGQVDRRLEPKVLHAGFVLALKVGRSFYCLAGGSGSWAVKKQPIERRFGIELVQKLLSSVSELKGMVQKGTEGQVNHLDRVFRSGYNPDGDVENLKRVLKNVRGRLAEDNKYFDVIGKNVVAGDSISIHSSKSFPEILKCLETIEEVWHSRVRGLRIPQLESIHRKHSAELIENLELQLVQVLLVYPDSQTESFILDNPDIGFLPDRAESYELKDRRQTVQMATHEEVFAAVARLMREVSDQDRLQLLRRLRLRVTFENGVYEEYHFVDFLCGDLTYCNDVYFLLNGLWFRAGKEFLATVDDALDNNIELLEPEALGLNEWHTRFRREEDFNNSHRTLIVLDTELVYVAGQRGGIEFCDLLKTENGGVNLIHVKKAKGAELRALFAQGFVASKLYAESQEFRTKVQTGQFGRSPSHRISSTAMSALKALSIRSRRQLKVIFAIFDDSPTHVPNNRESVTARLFGTLTAFAKTDLLERAVRLRAMGYDVAVVRIKPYPLQRARRQSGTRAAEAVTRS